MHILYVYADSDMEWNCSDWRCLRPANALNKTKDHSAKLLYLPSFVDFTNPAVADIVGYADIIIVQRNLIMPEVWHAIEYWRGLHKAVAADLDDGYPTLPWSNPAHEFWIRNKQKLAITPIEALTKGLRCCDALISPSRMILEDWADVVPGLYLPNYATSEWYANSKEINAARDPNKIVIGWGGSVSHYDSWWFSGIREALESIVKRRPNVYVKICGNDPRLFEQLDIPDDRKIRQTGVKAEEWPGIIATFDIGVAPLDMREGRASYDNRRSYLKAIEYMLAGVPWIASKSEVYAEMAEYGIVVDNTAKAWENAFLRIIDDMPKAQRRAERNRETGQAWTLEKSTGKLIECYERILELRQSQPQLPGIFYVNWDGKAGDELGDTTSASASPAPVPEARTAELEERRRAIQVASFAATGQWHRGLGLEHAGIGLGDAMAYDVIQRWNQGLLKQ